MRWSPVLALARGDLRSRWVTFVVLGLLAGVVGGLAVASLVVARRTDTAVTRLSDTAGVGDALVTIYGDTSLAGDVADLDAVSASVVLPAWIGLLDGPEVQPISLLADDGEPRAFFHPTLVEGRAVAAGAEDEVVMFESFARQTGVEIGTEVTLHLLSAAQSFRFGEGLGEPEGPTVAVRVVGTVRTSGVADQLPPLVAGPAFAEQYRDDVAGAAFVALQLEGGPRAAAKLETELQALQDTAGPIDGLEATAVDVAYPDRAGTDSARSSQHLLVGGLLAFATVVIGAGLLSLGQMLTRVHSTTRERAVVEAALGLTRTERVTVRALPGAVVVTVATLVAVAVALAAGIVEPLGALRIYEPSPGFAPNLAIVGLGAIGVLVIIGLVAAVAAVPSASIRTSPSTTRPSAVAQTIAGLPVRPAPMIGTLLAFEPARHRGGVPIRSVRLGLVLALTGVVAVVVVTSNLADLVRHPERYGATADLVISDASPEMFDTLQADDRISDLSMMTSGTVTVDGRSIGADAIVDRVGRAGWTLQTGSFPVTADEVVLGPRAGSKLDRGVGDVIAIEDPASDEPRALRVVGIGVGPDTSGGQLGDRVLLSPDTLHDLVEEPSSEGLARLKPGVDADSVLADYTERWEVHTRTEPAEISNLEEVGGLPNLLAGFLALVGISALANGLVVAVRRRRTTIAVLRTLGFTPRQSATTIMTMTGAVTLSATVVGVPLGLLLGAQIWRAIASSAAVTPAVSAPLAASLLIGFVGLVVALLVAGLPAARAARLRPAEILREH